MAELSQNSAILSNAHYIPKDFTCKICRVACSGPFPYTQHIRGDKHRKNVQLQEIYGVSETNSLLIGHGSPTVSELSSNSSLNDAQHMPKNFTCDECNIVCSGPFPYIQHLESDKHKKQASLNLMRKDNETQSFSPGQCNAIEASNVPEVTQTSLLVGMPRDFTCKLCNIPCSGPFPYAQHIKGEKHRKKEALYQLQKAGGISNVFENTASDISSMVFPQLVSSQTHIDEKCVNKGLQQNTVSSSTSSRNIESYANTTPFNCRDPVEKLGVTETDCSQSPSDANKQLCINRERQYDACHVDTAHVNTSEQPKKTETFETISLFNNNGPNQVNFFCEVCDIFCSGILQYEQHLKGDKHRKKSYLVKLQSPMATTDHLQKVANKDYGGIFARQPYISEQDFIEGRTQKELFYLTQADQHIKPSTDLELLLSECAISKKEMEHLSNSQYLSDEGVKIDKVPNSSMSVRMNYCDVCKLQLTSSTQYEQHVCGDKHRKMVIREMVYSGNLGAISGRVSPNSMFGTFPNANGPDVNHYDSQEFELKFTTIESSEKVHFDIP